MKRNRLSDYKWIHRSLAASIAFCTAGLNCTLGLSMEDISVPAGTAPLSKKATTEALGGEDRYLTFMSTDKPIYHCGEKVYVRGVLLNAANHKPWAAGQFANATIEIKGPKGDVVAGGNTAVQDSVYGFAWQVPEGQSGGEYTVHVTYPWNGFAPAERKFDIRAYRAPRLKSQITFLRDGYGPGERVNATLDVKRAEGGIPEGAKVTVVARVDGMEIEGESAKVGANGLCSVSFDLPHNIPRGEGTLALIIEDGGVVETASKTIPILLQTVDLQIFPESGDLIAGYPNRVYVQARQPNGKPADLAAKVMGKKLAGSVAELRTEHEGRGRFEITPAANRDYYLSVSRPAGIKTLYPLPSVKKDGALIHSDKNIFEKGEPITLHVGCTNKKFRISLAKREVVITKSAMLKPGGLQEITLKVPPEVDGVLTATIWDENDVPLAERLIFREQAHPLKIRIKPEKKTYIPGEQAKLTVKATDEDDKPVAAMVGLTVTDDSVLEMVEKREQPPRLPVMLFLEPEVKDLADAHVYLDHKNPKAPLATDLLLGTQGWRRFAQMDPAKFIEEYGDQARRALAMRKQTQVVYSMARRGALPGNLEGGKALFGQNAVFIDARTEITRAVAPMRPMPQAAVPMGMALPAVPKSAALMPPPPAMNMAADMAANMAPLAMVAPHAAQDDAWRQEGDAREGMRFRFEPKQKAFSNKKDVEQVAPSHGGGGAAAAAGLQQGAMAGAPVPVPHMAMKRMMVMDKPFAMPRGDMVIVREFAHQVRKDRKPTDRVDFSETLYWNTGVKTDANTGEATVSFGLNDNVSTFRVFADGFASDGAVGAANVGLEAVQPFYAEAKLPLEVTAGDQILLPINLINATGNKLAGASASVDLKGDFKMPEMLKGHASMNGAADINGGERLRWIQPIKVGFGNGLKDFTLNAKAGTYEDKITRELSVKPKGFPTEICFGGMLEPGQAATHSISIPEGVIAASIVSNTAVYPTPLANLTEALQRMIQDPNGCFEQTSSTSYPLTMAQQYFLSHTGIDPKLIEQSRQKLDAGYKRLVGFWCPDRGYEWFGQNPGHEALTAFGLLHFADMTKVREVDQNMVATTRDWLVKQKDGQGGFTRKRRSLHSWIEDKDCSNAYIVWALLETGQQPAELKTELESLKAAAASSQNYYVVALAANALHLAGQKAEAKKLMDRLAAKQKADGSVDGIKSSIVGSGGESLAVEGTSLATLAWLREPAYAGNVEKSIKFLADSCQAGRYGSTQATVLALRAIVTYDKQRSHPKAPGKVCLFVDGQPIGDWVEFNQHTEGAIKLPDLSELLTTGQHKLEVHMEGGGPMPYSLAVKYNTLIPASDKECKMDLTVKMAQNKVVEGAATEANVTVINKTNEVVPTPVAIVGLPGGLEPRHDQLKELVKKGKIDAYEVLGREIVLYWRSLPGDAKVEVPLSLIAAVPGTYTGPASRTYLYYTDEHKRWVDGLQVEIAAK